MANWMNGILLKKNDEFNGGVKYAESWEMYITAHTYTLSSIISHKYKSEINSKLKTLLSI